MMEIQAKGLTLFGGLMGDEICVMGIVAERMERAGIPYMLSGSMAMNFYAEPRMTRDVDLVAEIRPEDAERVAGLFTRDFVCDLPAILKAIHAQGMFNLIHIEWVVKVDIIIRKDIPFRIEEFRRRRKISVDNLDLWVASPEDLLLSKLHWAKDSRSEIQLRDAGNLASSVPELDWPYLERWAGELGVSQLLAEVRP